MSKAKIGILGGTFDPPHFAHLVIAQEVMERLDLDQVWFIPSFIPPHKRYNSVTSPRHRVQMLKLALAKSKKFKISALELKRKGISYTVDTLRELSLIKPGKKLYLILGSDNLKVLPDWKSPREIFRLARVVLVKRPGSSFSPANSWVKKAVTLEVPLLEISSSQIREKVKSGRDISHWVPERVKKYIEKHRLYKK